MDLTKGENMKNKKNGNPTLTLDLINRFSKEIKDKEKEKQTIHYMQHFMISNYVLDKDGQILELRK